MPARRILWFALLLSMLMTPLVLAQQRTRATISEILDFEGNQTGVRPRGWGGSSDNAVFSDDNVVHGGKGSARLERGANATGGASTLTAALPIDFGGARIQLHGFLKSENVTEFFGLWMREDAPGSSVAFDNMQSRQLKGTTDWMEYTIDLPLHPDARSVSFGVLLAGSGKLWADDLQLLVDGKPVSSVPVLERPKTPLDTDHEFDSSSRVTLTDLSPMQIANLATLGKVWGFLKYHHPAVVNGERHWDFDLFRIMPKILGARDRATANTVLHEWIAALPAVKDCSPCSVLDETELHLRPDLGWISDERSLGLPLSKDLQNVHKNRPAATKQFYVSRQPNINNPSFDNEAVYQTTASADAGFRLLALYRLWNIVQYWFPSRDVIGANWHDTLTEFIPRVATALTLEAFQKEMVAFTARINDGHASLSTSREVRPPEGGCYLPVSNRFIEGRALVTGYRNTVSGPESGLKRGDIIESIGGTRVADLVMQWSPWYEASNEPARLLKLSAFLTGGACGPVAVTIRRGAETLELTATRVPRASLTNPGIYHDRAGEAFQKLSPDVAYLKLSAVQAIDAEKYVNAAKGTRGLIIDIRNYPSSFIVFALGTLLVDKPTPFARITQVDLANPGATHFGPPFVLRPRQPHYEGKIVILTDDVSLSLAEYTTMAFRSVPNAVVVGSTTAGADGDVSRIDLPGGMRTFVSGLGVFYPDKKPTQRLGITPDIEVKPTIEGFRAGRDELLEEAIRQILGPATARAEIEQIAK